MSDLAELKRLAEAAVKRPWPSKAATSFALAIDPATTLSLIERVEKAEAHASMLQMAVGEASKTAWTQGRSEALEEAAKVADAHEQSADGKFDGVIKASRNGEKKS